MFKLMLYSRREHRFCFFAIKINLYTTNGIQTYTRKSSLTYDRLHILFNAECVGLIAEEKFVLRFTPQASPKIFWRLQGKN